MADHRSRAKDHVPGLVGSVLVGWYVRRSGHPDDQSLRHSILIRTELCIRHSACLASLFLVHQEVPLRLPSKGFPNILGLQA
jgi:hypothetical protein